MSTLRRILSSVDAWSLQALNAPPELSTRPLTVQR